MEIENYYWAYPNGQTEGTTVFEKDLRISRVLGPDGEPLVVLDKRQPVGFQLSKTKSSKK